MDPSRSLEGYYKIEKVPKIVLLTSGLINSRKVAIILNLLEINFDIITISHSCRKKRETSLLNFLKITLLDTLSNIKYLRIIKQRSLPPYPKKTYYAGRPNSVKLLKILDKKKPDYIFLFAGNLISSEVIGKAKKGVINVHPGLLPWLRGSDVIKHAILRDIPIGVTSHFVDTGIDTGKIIFRYLLPINKNESFKSIKGRLSHLICAVFIDLAVSINDGNKIFSFPQIKKFPLCRIIDQNENLNYKNLTNSLHAFNLYKKSLHSNCNITSGDVLISDYLCLLRKYDLLNLL